MRSLFLLAKSAKSAGRWYVSLAEETTIIESKFTSERWSVNSSAVSVFFTLSYIRHLLRGLTPEALFKISPVLLARNSPRA